MDDIEKKYNEISGNHSLPGYEDLNREFEIYSVEESEFLLREIRKKIVEKIDDFLKVLEPVLQPETILSDMHECRFFSDSDKREIFSTYKRLKFFEKMSFETSIDENDEKTAKFINSVFSEWSNLKQDVLEVILKLKDSWLQDTDIEEELGYMG